MQIPLKYILRSSSSRRLTTGVTILGIALVVFVFYGRLDDGQWGPTNLEVHGFR